MYVCIYVCTPVCTYVCTYVRTYICMYVCMYVCVCTYVCMHLCMYVCIYVCTPICTYVCMYACTYVCTYICMCVCMYVCVCTYVHMHVCIYLWYSSKATSRALTSYGRVTSNLQGYIESPYFSKRIIQKSVMQCYNTVHDTAGKNNPLQWLSPFQESVLSCSLNTQSYENYHNSLTAKDIFDL